MPKAQPLEYQAAEPAFLRRMKANHLALNGRHNVQIPRATGGMGMNDRLNMKGEDGDDEPLVVDENGNVVSKEEVERMEGEQGNEEDGKVGGDKSGDGKVDQTEDLVKRPDEDGKVSSGFAKKRKAVKIIAQDAKDDVDEKEKSVEADEQVKSLKDSTKDLKSVVAQGKEDAKKEEPGKKSKRKKIKLSFDEPE